MKSFLSQALTGAHIRLCNWRAERAFKKDMQARKKASIAAFQAWWKQAAPYDQPDRNLRIQSFCMYLPQDLLDRFMKEMQRRQELAR